MHNEKEHYESFFSFFKNEKQKIWEKLEIITYKPKIFETVDIKSDIIEHPKTSHKFSNTIRKGKNPNNSLYSDTKKVQIFWRQINVKITTQVHAFKGYNGAYNVKILNSFNPELQFKNTKSVIKSKLIKLLSELRGFRFGTTLALVFKKIESKEKTKYDNFYSSSKAEKIINKSDIENAFK